MTLHALSQFVLLLLAARRLDISRASESEKCKPNIFILGGSTVGKGTIGKELQEVGYQGYEVDKHLWRKGARSSFLAVVWPGIKRRSVYQEAADLPTSTSFFIDESVWLPKAFGDVFEERRDICKLYMFKHLPLLWNHTIKRNREAVERKHFHEVRSLHVVMTDLLKRYATLSFDPCHDNVQEESAQSVGETPYLEKIPFKEASEAFDKAQQELHELAKDYPDLQSRLFFVGFAGYSGYSEDGVYDGLLAYTNHDRNAYWQPPSRTNERNTRNTMRFNATSEEDHIRDRDRNQDREKEWLYVCPKPFLRHFKRVSVREGHSKPRMLAGEAQTICASTCKRKCGRKELRRRFRKVFRKRKARLSLSINMEGTCDARNEALAHLYCIDVTNQDTGETLRVFHRYTDFRVLRTDLREIARFKEKPFPPKLLLPCFSTQCEDELSAKRRHQLWQWLEQQVRESEHDKGMAALVADFLQPDSKKHKSRTASAKEWLTNAKDSVVGAVKAALAPSLAAEALVVIDVQHCFTNGETSDGKRVTSKRDIRDRGLQSDRGDKAWKASVVKYVKQWMSRKQPIVLLQDFHPDKHVSFITGGTGEEKWHPTDNIKSRTMGERVFLSSNSGQVPKKKANFKKMQYDAPVFPSHCVKGTEEVKLIDGLCEAVGGVYDKDFACKVDADKYPNVKVVQKGANKNIDSFGGIYDNRMGYITELQGFASRELAERSSWGVLEWLNSKGVKSVETIGIADDYCVKTTALDLANKQKAEMVNAIAIPHVVINPQYTYGIVAQLWEKDVVGHGVREVYENLIGDLYQSKLGGNGKVEVKRQPAKREL